MASDHCLYKKLRLLHCCSNFGSSLYRHQHGLIKFLSNIDTKVMLEDNAANLIDNYLQLQNYTALQLVFLLEIGIQTL